MDLAPRRQRIGAGIWLATESVPPDMVDKRNATLAQGNYVYITSMDEFAATATTNPI